MYECPGDQMRKNYDTLREICYTSAVGTLLHYQRMMGDPMHEGEALVLEIEGIELTIKQII